MAQHADEVRANRVLFFTEDEEADKVVPTSRMIYGGAPSLVIRPPFCKHGRGTQRVGGDAIGAMAKVEKSKALLYTADAESQQPSRDWIRLLIWSVTRTTAEIACVVKLRRRDGR
jgi:hypothetical protein